MKDNINKFIHSKIFIIIMLLILIGLVGGVGTYAWFTWRSTNNTSLTLTIGKIADVTFDTGNNINTTNLAPVFNYTDGEKTTFSINNKDTSGATISYSVKLNITTISSELVSDSLKYKLVSNGEEIGSGTFSSVSSGSSLTIGMGTLPTGITDFVFYLYIDGNIENNPNMMNKTLTGTIEVTASEGSLSSNTLAKLGLSVDTEHTPDFNTISGTSGIRVDGLGSPLDEFSGDNTNGIYEAEDDLGTSYYFRGNVQNNFVSFAGYTWRIVRINGDGTIRMITSDSMGTSKFNTDSGDNAYVGYMYGTTGSSTYENTHANVNDSTIKTYLDNWYMSNLSSYSSYIADAIYCNDRGVTSVTSISNFPSLTFTGNGYGTEKTSYSGFKRLYVDHAPTLKCTNNNDKFTVSTGLGNGALTYPIGLITSDELAMAGTVGRDYFTYYNYPYLGNNEYYLYVSYTNNPFWTMTPTYFDSSSRINRVYIVYFVDGGDLGNSIDDTSCNVQLSVRPVISLNADAISGGSGTKTDPFVVG